jgi:large subunit ribosomal protein L24
VKVKIKKGDTVQVISGDDKGSKGTVHRVYPEKEQIVVSGVNMIKKHQRQTGQTRTQVGIIEREAPVHLSNVALVCNKCQKPTRTGYRVFEDGSKGRMCKRCGEVID